MILLIKLIFSITVIKADKIDNLCDDSFPWDNARLPQTIYPIHYDLVIHPNISKFKFRGSINMIINITKPSKFIVINMADLNVENISLRTQNGQRIPIKIGFCVFREQMAIIPAYETSLHNGLKYNLSMLFRGEFTEKLKGLYRSSYKSENGAKKYIAITQFSPTDARRMFPCFDEPLFKATFQTSIIRDRSLISLSNMPIRSTIEISDNLVMDNFETTLTMSTYLIAIAVLDFPKRTKKTKTGVEISIYAPPLQINQTTFALDAAVDSLEFHETFLNVPYPLKKLDIIAAGDFAFTAMENWGLMIFRDTVILNDAEQSSVLDEDSLVTVLSHEIGHQWFGNLVTMKWWADLWLKEGFARFLETYAASKIRPNWGLLELFGPNVLSYAFELDSLNNTHSVNVPVSETSEIRGVFDSISYNKGASIIYMLLKIVGERNLADGLNEYLKTYKYSNVDGPQFWETLSKHVTGLYDLRFDQIADTWTLQPGYPYIEITINSSALILNQKRFYYYQTFAEENSNNATWVIPFTFTIDTNANRLIWFNTTNLVIPLEQSIKQCLKANTNGTGFYRVLYPTNIWRTFSRMLKNNYEVFSIMDRSNLIMDAFGFLRAGLLNLTYAFELAEYLRNETEYGPWIAALSAFDKIDNIHMSSPLTEKFRSYLRMLLEPVYKRISWILPANHKQRRFVAKILASSCQYNVGDCTNRAIEILKNYLNDGTKISPDLLATVLSSAVRKQPEKYWDIIWKEYLKSNVPAEKTTILTSLCYTPKEKQLLWLLNAAMNNSEVRPNLLPYLAISIASNPNNGLRIMWNFTKDNWDRIFEIAGGNAILGNYLSYSLNSFSRKDDLDEIIKYFTNRDVNGAKRSLDQTLENIRINIQWRELNDGDLENYIRRL